MLVNFNYFNQTLCVQLHEMQLELTRNQAQEKIEQELLIQQVKPKVALSSSVIIKTHFSYIFLYIILVENYVHVIT